jgi:hypothetical protein
MTFFPIGSYVKTTVCPLKAAILVGGLKCQTYIWKGTTQGSFQQSLVEIGSVVSEETFQTSDQDGRHSRT